MSSRTTLGASGASGAAADAAPHGAVDTYRCSVTFPRTRNPEPSPAHSNTRNFSAPPNARARASGAAAGQPGLFAFWPCSDAARASSRISRFRNRRNARLASTSAWLSCTTLDQASSPPAAAAAATGPGMNLVPTPNAIVTSASSPPGVCLSAPRAVSCATTAATTAAPRVAE